MRYWDKFNFYLIVIASSGTKFKPDFKKRNFHGWKIAHLHVGGLKFCTQY